MCVCAHETGSDPSQLMATSCRPVLPLLSPLFGVYIILYRSQLSLCCRPSTHTTVPCPVCTYHNYSHPTDTASHSHANARAHSTDSLHPLARCPHAASLLLATLTVSPSMHRTYSMRQSRAPTASQIQNPPPAASSTKGGRLFGRANIGKTIAASYKHCVWDY